MDPKPIQKGAQPQALGSYLVKKAAMHSHHSMGGDTSIRNDTYLGHSITLKTTYTVEIDGKKTNLNLVVDDSGTVHCHSLPNYKFQSALDMVKTIIGQFPDEFPVKAPKAKKSAPKVNVPKRKSPSKKRKL